MINILFFAHLQEVVGHEKLELNIAPLKVKELKQHLVTTYGLNRVDQIMFAINEEYANDEEMINHGDTVALIPPVSGG
ncbi:molybdopterin converting factor subunit 1 [Bacillus sp. PS06]|uniref:molybdopterin converting factor subunit 1 n=1 Tax=Bacillus sp. PS06 TaxID=2764176 RepID=UPI001786BC30|nr:molybdopterin converting factor subunit 1 [Bacillus sp. PS06]MBD8067560.1 molybdopterin converting factor subunit 1 [Bacillus sp. PS06]